MLNLTSKRFSSTTADATLNLTQFLAGKTNSSSVNVSRNLSNFIPFLILANFLLWRQGGRKLYSTPQLFTENCAIKKKKGKHPRATTSLSTPRALKNQLNRSISRIASWIKSVKYSLLLLRDSLVCVSLSQCYNFFGNFSHTKAKRRRENFENRCWTMLSIKKSCWKKGITGLRLCSNFFDYWP